MTMSSFSRRSLIRGAIGAGGVFVAAGVLPLGHAFAQTVGDVRTVNSNNVRLRAGAGTTFGVVAVLANGTKVTVVSTVSQAANGYTWFNVKVNTTGTTGWIATEFLSSGTGTGTGSSWDKLPVGSAVYVNTPTMNFRSTPNGTVIRVVPSGAKATTLGQTASADGVEWIKVTLVSTGEAGWLATQYLSTSAVGNPGNPGSAWSTGTAVHVDNVSLNLRSDASLSASVKKVYPNGTNAVTTGAPTVADGYTWYPVKVTADGNTGYFIGEGLAKGSTSEPAPVTDRIRVVDGPVNLRSAAGTGNSVVQVLQTGATGDRWSTESPNANGYTWVKMRVDGTQSIGWVAREFITFY